MNRGRLAVVVAAGAGTTIARRALRERRKISFQDQVVVITGGARGLGLVLARHWAAEGARLAILARDATELEGAREQLLERDAQALFLPCDVRDEGEVQATIARVVERYGRIDVLVNNAGVIQAGPIEHMQVTDFEDAMAVHFRGPLFTMRATVPHMRRQGGGRIVNIASIGGLVAVPHLVPYSASKFALVGLSDGMRAELAKDGIRVTTVSPGLMRTGSPPNALFKGRHKAEYGWFALGDALPITSMSAERAAVQILTACRYGDAELTLTIQARLLSVARALCPALLADALALANRLLPAPTTAAGDHTRTGWESQSSLAPSPLTRLSDAATDANNELRGRAGRAAHPTEEAPHPPAR